MTEQKTVQEALAAVKRAVGAVSKSQRNAQQGFNFRGVDDVVNAASGPLNEHGVIVSPWIEDYTYETVEVGRNKTPMAHIMVTVTYSFTGPAGDVIKAKVLAESMDSGDKGAAKAMSVAYRIALLQVLNLPTDSPDPDHDTYERSSQTVTAESSSRPRAAAPRAQKPEKTEKEEPPTAATAADIAAFVKMINEAKTSDALNRAWTAIGARGALQAEIDHDGGKVTLEKYLFLRNDAIKSGGGN